MTDQDRIAWAEQTLLEHLFNTADLSLMGPQQLADVRAIHDFAREVQQAVWQEAADKAEAMDDPKVMEAFVIWCRQRAMGVGSVRLDTNEPTYPYLVRIASLMTAKEIKVAFLQVPDTAVLAYISDKDHTGVECSFVDEMS